MAERGRWRRSWETWRRSPASTLIIAGAVQAVILVVTIGVVVMRPRSRPHPAFVAAKKISVAEQQLEQAANLADFEEASGGAAPLERLSVKALVPGSVPSLPAMPEKAFSAGPSDDWLDGAAGVLAGDTVKGMLGGLNNASSTASFFGVKDTGKRIVLIVNTSASVLRKARAAGYSIAAIQREAAKLLGRLSMNTEFGIVQFSQGTRVFATYLVPATKPNKRKADAWIKTELKGNPPISDGQTLLGHEAAFAAAFKLQPDIIFLVTDGVLNRRERRDGHFVYPEISYRRLETTVSRLENGNPRPARIHVVGFRMRPKDAEKMESFVSPWGGSVRLF